MATEANLNPIGAAPQMELMFRASERLLEQSREKIFIKDKNLIYRGASNKFARMAGWDHGTELIGKTDFEIFEDQELALRYREDDIRLISRQTDLIDYVEPITEKDGQHRYASTSKYLLRDINDNIIGLVGVSRDITMDYYLQRNRVRELEYLFTLPTDVFFASYLDIDDWRIISEHHQPVRGYSFSHHSKIENLAANAHNRIMEHHWPAYAFYCNFTSNALRSLYESGKTSLSMEYPRMNADGETHWVRDEISFLKDAVSDHLCMMLVVRDIQQSRTEEEERIRLQERDELTGLMNRKATMQLIRSRISNARPGEQHALVMLDADYFKLVNDNYGHQAGDQILAVLGQTIGHCFTDTDLVGRIGGDEFFVLMTDVPDRHTVEDRLNRLLRCMQEISYEKVRLSASIGVALFPGDSDSLEGLYALSDKAMYTVKERGRNGICFAADLPASLRSTEPNTP